MIFSWQSLLPLVLIPVVANARPSPMPQGQQQEGRGLFDSHGVPDDIILFDSPAFPDPRNHLNTLVQLQAYVSVGAPDLGNITTAMTAILSRFGISVGDSLNTLQERIKLIASVGVSGKKVVVSVPGCTLLGKLPPTSGSDLGLANGNSSLGRCLKVKELTGHVVQGPRDSRARKIKASIFSSPNSGFGVISDIDDTVKITNVLDTVALLKSTLLEEPKAVAGMPKLYASLAKSLKDPQFVYITASPYQLYPFLNTFLDTTYPTAKGPIFPQNLTITDLPQALLFLMNTTTILQYKVSMVDRIKGMYPKKKWLAIGDSTQKDPETYGESFRKYGDSIICSWIRRVEGANNTDARFAEAFRGVPTNKFRIFTDAEIPSLAKINVARGEC